MDILFEFHKNQEFMLRKFSARESTESLSKSVKKFFCCFFFLMLGSYAGITVTFWIIWPDFKLWCAQYVVMTFIIHAQSFQILAYSKLIHFQLKIFNVIAIEKLDLKGQEDFRKTLLTIHEFSEKVNRTFAAPLLAVISYFYISVLSNLHWFFMSLFNMTHLSGECTANCF